MCCSRTHATERRNPLAPAQGRLRARLYERGAVLGEQVDDAGALRLEVRLPRRELDQLLAGERAARN